MTYIATAIALAKVIISPMAPPNSGPKDKVSLLGVDSLWGDCTFIPADWGS
jgi:hypothetical protein